MSDSALITRDVPRDVCARHGAKARICSHDGCGSKAKRGGVCWRHGGKYLAIARGVIIMPRRRVGCANDISGSRGQRRRVLKTVMFGARTAVSTRTMIIHCQKFRMVQQHSSNNNSRHRVRPLQRSNNHPAPSRKGRGHRKVKNVGRRHPPTPVPNFQSDGTRRLAQN